MDLRTSIVGSWRVRDIITAGKKKVWEEGDEQFFWITDTIILTGTQDAAWDLPYTLNCGVVPPAIDITRNDRWEPWVDLAVIEVVGDTLRICVAGTPDGPRPDTFESSEANDRTLYVAERCDEPVPE